VGRGGGGGGGGGGRGFGGGGVGGEGGWWSGLVFPFLREFREGGVQRGGICVRPVARVICRPPPPRHGADLPQRPGVLQPGHRTWGFLRCRKCRADGSQAWAPLVDAPLVGAGAAFSVSTGARPRSAASC